MIEAGPQGHGVEAVEVGGVAGADLDEIGAIAERHRVVAAVADLDSCRPISADWELVENVRTSPPEPPYSEELTITIVR